MKEFEKRVLEELLAYMNLAKCRMEYGNQYVFGYDDVSRIIINKIKNL